MPRPRDTTAVDPSTQELDSFNNDVRLRAIKTLCDSLLPIQQKKALLYFSSGMQRNGSDNQVELRAARMPASAPTSRSTRSTRAASRPWCRAAAASGQPRRRRRVLRPQRAHQFAQLAAQQETLQALAADTGGTAFTDSNDFGEAFDKVQKDISPYYILGLRQLETEQDGRFRGIDVRLKPKMDAKLRRARATTPTATSRIRRRPTARRAAGAAP